MREQWVREALLAVESWERRWGPVADHPALRGESDRIAGAWREYAERMASSYPFFHPRYAGQMLKPPHPVAAAAYLAAMLVNPNNHALDGGPVTSELEKEVVSELAGMFRLPGDALGHLTSSGTIANLEALWVARESHPGKAILHGENAHYTHGRMCRVLGVPARTAPADAAGRMDLDAVEAACASGDVGTVVLTAGTTGLGAVDRVDEALALRDRHGVRLHVDAAYGGFFALLDGEPFTPAMRAIAQCDSVVIDPHKHGLQPYGCGAVLFADPAVGRFYRHDSPYTYFTSDELHLGEISLECSRAGAAAAALWVTLRALDLAPVLRACLRAARGWAERIAAADDLVLHLPPELDIVTYFPVPAERSGAAVDALVEAVLEQGMADREDPLFLSALRVDRAAFESLHPGFAGAPDGGVRVLRSVLMKPEHEHVVDWLHGRVLALAAAER